MAADKTTQIFLPLIDPAEDRNAFPVARSMANTLQAPLHVVAAAPAQPADIVRLLPASPEDLDGVSTAAVSGDFVRALSHMVDIAGKAMVVLPVRLRNGFPGLPATRPAAAVKRHVLEKINCPILVAPTDRDMSHWQLRRELLPQDGTPESACALAQVISQSSQRGIENLVLRIAGARVCQPAEPGSLATPRYVDHPQYEWDAWNEEFLDRLRRSGAKLNAASLKLLVAAGEPATDILRIAAEETVDMIILPWHRTLGSGRARMIKAVLQKTPCPVLLLPERSDVCD